MEVFVNIIKYILKFLEKEKDPKITFQKKKVQLEETLFLMI